jgi:uncharacterized protein (TIGR02001 family)
MGDALVRAEAFAAIEDMTAGQSRSLETVLNALPFGGEESGLIVQAEETGGQNGEEYSRPISITFDLAAVSDYRFRGVSLSHNDPALQPTLTVSHKSGLYLSAWGSNIARFADTNVELDLTAGWNHAAGGAELSVGVIAYLYPGGNGGSYTEIFGSIGTTLGPVEIKGGSAYAPPQKNIGSDNFYVYGSLSSGIPGTPVTISAQVGHENGSLAGPSGEKWDWSLGAQYVLGKVSLGLNYVDTNIKHRLDQNRTAQSSVVASILFSF